VDAGVVGVFILQFAELFILLYQYSSVFKSNMRLYMSANQFYSVFSTLKMEAIRSSETSVEF
jgi:hypothetical protein